VTPRPDIKVFVARWRELTQAEGVAISAAAWASVAEIQAMKAKLQPELTEAIKFLEQEALRNPSAAQEKDSLRAEVKRLISLEGRNQDLVTAQRKRFDSERLALDQARGNLRKVRQSYAGKCEAAAWQQYS
jgi:hypothetical protein